MYELPYGNTQQLNLDWFIKRWQEFYTQWQETEAGIDHALDAEVQRVEDAMTDLYAARDAAAASATAAAASATSASNDATIAANAATAAAASATLANTKATAAGLSEAAAALSASQAANDATAAATSASQASASASSATDSAQAAAASATAADSSADDAADSATAAAGSATAAAGSASDAADSATAAAASAASLVVDSAMSDSSTNPVQNKVINGELTELKTAIIHEIPVSYISNVDSTLIGIHVKKLSRTQVELYGTATASGIRYITFINDGFEYLTSSVNPFKPFPKGKYKFEIASSISLPTGVYFTALFTTSSDGIIIEDGNILEMQRPFIPSLKIPKNADFGTSSNPTIITINVIKIGEIDDNVLIPTGDGTDVANDIKRILSSFGECKLIDGDYYVSGIDMPEKTKLIGNGANTRVILNSNVTSGSAVKMANACSVENLSIIGSTEEITFTQGDITSIHIGTRHGILWKGEATGDTSSSANNTHFQGIVSNCWISSFTGGAITCESTGYSIIGGLTATSCKITNCGAGINISWWSEYNCFKGITACRCYYGCINNAGNNVFNGCNFSGNEVGFYMYGGTDKCVLSDGTVATSRNDGHGIAFGCTFNHCGLFETNAGYAIYARSIAAGFVFTSFQIQNCKVFFRLCSRIMLNDGNFGNDIDITCYSTNSYMFAACFFHSSVKLYPYDQNTDELITTFDSDGNLARIKFLNCYDSTFEAVTAQTLASNS